MKNISLDMVRCVEAAAIAAAKLIGSGDKLEIDRVATEAIRKRLNNTNFCGFVSTCEGIKDASFHLESEYVGKLIQEYISQKNKHHLYSLVLDPVDGTTQCSIAGSGSMSALAISYENCMYKPKSHYMNKLAYGPKIFSKVKLNINDPIERTIELTSLALNKKINNIMVCLLNRPRNQPTIDKLRNMNVKVKLLSDCDIGAAIETCLPGRTIDLFYGIGGGPESLLGASAVKSMGGSFQSYEVDENWKQCSDTMDETNLIVGDTVFVATGILDGTLLNGIKFTEDGRYITHSIFTCSESQTIRWLTTTHGN